MEEMKENSSLHEVDKAYIIISLASQRETAESQQTAENSAWNNTQTQGSEGQNRDNNMMVEVPNIAATNANVSMIHSINWDYEKMVYFKELQLASNALQYLSHETLEEPLNDPVQEVQNVVISETGTTYTIRHNFERFSELYRRKATPADSVAPENNQITENVLNTHSASINNNNENPNTPNTYRATPQHNVPAVILRSVQKLFAAGQSNITNNQVFYPMNVNTSTPNVNYDQNYNVAASESTTLLANSSTDQVPLNLKVESVTAGKLQEREQPSTSYPVNKLARKHIDYRHSLLNHQFSQFGNYKRRTGLTNNGLTCYLNSVIQVLLATNKFSTLTVLGMYKYPYWSKLAKLFGVMMYTVQPAVNPSKYYVYLNSKHFNIFSEHDASEFLTYMFEQLKNNEPNWDDLNDDLALTNEAPSTSAIAQDNAVAGCSYQTQTDAELTPRKRKNIEVFDYTNKSYIDNFFGGVVTTTVMCQVCSADSNKHERVYMLSLPIPDVIKDEVLRVQKILFYYFTTEMLTGDNRYLCGTCLHRQEALKFSVFVRNPKYLILTLKNFRYDSEKKNISKKICKIHCDRKIMLPSKVSQRELKTYELYAMIVHCGKFLDTGHYTAFTKCKDQWYKINDKIVITIEENKIDSLDVDEIPYLLFYRRSDIEEGEFPEFDKIPWLSKHVQGPQSTPSRF